MQDEARPPEKGERKLGLSKGIFNIGEVFEFTEKEIEDLFDHGAR